MLYGATLPLLLVVLLLPYIASYTECPRYCVCAHKEVTCTGKSLNKVPGPLPSDTRVLRLEGTAIERLRNDSLTRNDAISELYVKGGRLSRMDATALQTMTNLRTLVLSGNRLTQLHRKSLQGCRSLQALDLSDNAFIILPDDALRGLKFLTTLKFAGNQLLVRKLPASFSQLTSIRHLDFSRNPKIARHMGDNWFQSVQGVWNQRLTLNLSFCGLAAVSSNVFRNLSLESLSLSGNVDLDVNRVLKGTDTTKLTHLELSSLGIADIRPLFRDARYLKPLRDLDLSRNVITSVTSFSLKHLTNLQSLRLDHNLISKYGKIGDLGELKQLYLSHNELTELESNALETTRGLVHIDLSYNRFVFITPLMFKSNFNLRTLDISHCRLRELNFEYMESVLSLDASFNRIGDLSFANILVSVKRLDVSNNLIERLPVLTLPFVYVLNVSGNVISEVDEGALRNTGLGYLDMSDNRLTSLDAAVAFPYSLVELNLTRNRISAVQRSAFEDMSDLRVLDMSFNRLADQMDVEALRPLTSLERVSFAGNRKYGPYFGRDYAKLGAYLSSLKVLSLKDISLKELNEDTFINLGNLEELDLSKNHLKTFPPKLSEPLTKLDKLSLASNDRLTVLNPLSFQRTPQVDLSGLSVACDCNLVPLMRWLMLKTTQVVGTSPVCSLPSELSGRRVYGLLLSATPTEECYHDTNDEMDGGQEVRDTAIVIAVAVGVACFVVAAACIAAVCVCRWKIRGHRKFPHTSPSRRHVYRDCKSSSADDSSRTIRTTASACSYTPPPPHEVCPLKKEWV